MIAACVRQEEESTCIMESCSPPVERTPNAMYRAHFTLPVEIRDLLDESGDTIADNYCRKFGGEGQEEGVVALTLGLQCRTIMVDTIRHCRRNALCKRN